MNLFTKIKKKFDYIMRDYYSAHGYADQSILNERARIKLILQRHQYRNGFCNGMGHFDTNEIFKEIDNGN